MKISIAASILIALLTLTLGWQNQQKLTAVRENREQLQNRANDLGISVTETGGKESARPKRETRADRDLAAKQMALDFITFSKEAEKTKSTNDEKMMLRSADFMDRFATLDVSQLKILIAEFQKDPESTFRQRDRFVGFVFRALSNDRPELALSLLTGTTDLFSDSRRGADFISLALNSLAKTNPTAALEWVKENREKFPDLITEHTKRNLIAAAASYDPKLAFSMIAELEIDHAPSTVGNITAAPKTSEERIATLHALREYLSGKIAADSRREIVSSAFQSLANGVAKTGFEDATQWISAAKFTPDELEKFTLGLHYYNTREASGKWLEWLGENLPPEKANQQIRNVVSSWTEQDFKATGEWLVAAPEGPVKNTAVQSYAETVSRYDPETAVEWAQSLPAGISREQTLKNIHRNWPKDDPASAEAAEAFAEEHGIEE